MSKNVTLTQEELKSIIYYNPLDGNFIWKKNRRSTDIGKKAGSLTNRGYVEIGINKKSYTIHRLIFLYMIGSIPNCVDHIDGNRSNNKWINLREATHVQNGGNKIKHSNNTTGVKGVTFHKKNKISPWVAEITFKRKSYYIGSYKTKKEASDAYDKKAIEFHGKFAKTNKDLNYV